MTFTPPSLRPVLRSGRRGQQLPLGGRPPRRQPVRRGPPRGREAGSAPGVCGAPGPARGPGHSRGPAQGQDRQPGGGSRGGWLPPLPCAGRGCVAVSEVAVRSGLEPGMFADLTNGRPDAGTGHCVCDQCPRRGPQGSGLTAAALNPAQPRPACPRDPTPGCRLRTCHLTATRSGDAARGGPACARVRVEVCARACVHASARVSVRVGAFVHECVHRCVCTCVCV